MKPHRRKNTPPRRESDPAGQNPESASSGAEDPHSDPSTYEAPEQPYVDPGEMHADPNQPGQVDPGQQGYVDPNQQAYYDASVPEPTPQPASDAGVYDDSPAPAPVSKKKRVRKKVVKKKAARRGPARRPATGPGRPGYRKPAPTYGGGVSVMSVFLGICAIVMLGVVVMVVLPQDLSRVAGYPVDPITAGEPSNILAEVQEVMISREKELVYSEQEVNQYLNARLVGNQQGLMSSLVNFEGIYVDFTPGFAEIIVERSMFGLPITMSSTIKAEQFRRQVVYKPSEWSIGKLSFKSKNIKPIIEMFVRLRETCREEFQAMKMMADVRFEEDQIVLDPTLGG